MNLGISESVWSLFPGDKGGSGLKGVVLGVDILSPLLFVGSSGNPKSLGMLAMRNLGM